jgi:hypothetical protein
VFGLLQKMLPKIYNKLLAMLLKNWQKTLKFVQLLFANSFKNVLIYCTKAIVFFKLAVFYLCLSYFLQRWQYGWNKTFFLWNSFQYSVVAQLSIGMKCPPPIFYKKKMLESNRELRMCRVRRASVIQFHVSCPYSNS